jgi:hypothetical protein
MTLLTTDAVIIIYAIQSVVVQTKKLNIEAYHLITVILFQSHNTPMEAQKGKDV